MYRMQEAIRLSECWSEWSEKPAKSIIAQIYGYIQWYVLYREQADMYRGSEKQEFCLYLKVFRNQKPGIK
jgi:hypothetical protein